MNLKTLLFLPALTSALIAGAIGEAQSSWKVFFDPRLGTSQVRLTSRQRDILRGDAYALLSRAQNLCAYDSTGPEIVGTTQGSFTRARSNQTAYSVRLCHKPSYDANSRVSSTTDSLYGLFVYENERLIDSFTSKIPGNLYSTRDVNQNGRSELVYFEEVRVGGYSPVYVMNLFVTEFDSRGNLQRIGQRDNVQRWNADGSGFEYTISVLKGRNPVFKAALKTLDVSSGYPVVVGVQNNVSLNVLF